MGYAVSRILVTRQDSGRKAFNFSEVLGSFSSSALAVTYYPKSQRDFSDVAERAGIQFAFDAGFNVLKEFYPEIERKLFRQEAQVVALTLLVVPVIPPAVSGGSSRTACRNRYLKSGH